MKIETFSELDTLDIGIVHDWLPTVGGGEGVLKEMVRLFPQAHVYTLFDFLTPEERAQVVGSAPLSVSRLNRLPGVRRYYRYLLLQCTRAIEEFDVTGHDVVLSSSAALAKGVITSPDQKHVAYVHSPARYAWDLTHEYIGELGGLGGALKRRAAREMMHRFRKWDMRTVNQVDTYVANSRFIARRIWKTWRREAQVIYPPVDTSAFDIGTKPREEFYFTASRMVPYKRIPMIVEAFSQRPDLRLVVSGDGPEMDRVRAAAGPNVTLLGHAPFDVMRDHMQRARGFVFAAREDFGIVPVEAQACGTPVIALGHGGTAETVRDLSQDDPTGVWFRDQTIPSLLEAVDRMEENLDAFNPETCRRNALGFGVDRFRRELAECVAAQLR
ncbi:glycosyltransferase [Pseudooceanicola marinus]|uniref:glycosyltransferase n=1 Tax=Pseudooceanicola marinus TaxID=396013 RepID=UPI001CD308E2|nr:glycosyltransferase [Pseudooceanicola marinus]MCA1338149.1 glycosyltransferase [Pseudooceanicola marinus]